MYSLKKKSNFLNIVFRLSKWTTTGQQQPSLPNKGKEFLRNILI